MARSSERRVSISGDASRLARYRFRSAITGKFVTLLYALRHPFTTIRELVSK